MVHWFVKIFSKFSEKILVGRTRRSKQVKSNLSCLIQYAVNHCQREPVSNSQDISADQFRRLRLSLTHIFTRGVTERIIKYGLKPMIKLLLRIWLAMASPTPHRIGNRDADALPITGLMRWGFIILLLYLLLPCSTFMGMYDRKKDCKSLINEFYKTNHNLKAAVLIKKAYNGMPKRY